MSLQELIIVTGLSGSGKRSLIKIFEDTGYFCVDNLPVQLIPRLLELSQSAGGEINRLALVIDVREGQFLDDFKAVYRRLKKQSFRTLLIFMEASEPVLVKRFSEVRRPHPMAPAGSVLEGIALERQRLRELRELADLVIDTSDLSVHGLRRYVLEHFRSNGAPNKLQTTIITFGYKYGIPFESDLVFDVRFLPNPNFIPRLKNRDGRDRQVCSYMKAFPEVRETIARIADLLSYLIPKYMREGKSYLTISIGCTGGRHRSVYVGERLQRALKRSGFPSRVIHRDLEKR